MTDAEYTATVRWERGEQPFADQRYSRRHEWRFDGGATVAASSSPHVLPAPLSDPAAVDPEEAFVASLSSCHMLWFLALAAKRGFRIDSYVDEAVGVMGKGESGRTAMTKVTLRPRITFTGDRLPDSTEVASLHEEAHEKCYIANSVKTDVVVETT